jgi:hypothetical protein
MTEDLARIAAGLSEAAKLALHAVCRTNGGSVSIRCIGRDGQVVPLQRPMRRLFDLSLIQGKSGGIEKVVHTPLGLAVRNHLKGSQ